jgi:phage gp29-like protein
LRIPEASDSEAVFGAAPAVPAGQAGASNPPPPAAAALTAQPATDGRDAIDELVDAETADWQPLLDPLLDPLKAALAASAAAGESAAEFLARLPALLAEMDAAPLAERLARTTFTARLAGNAGVSPDA